MHEIYFRDSEKMLMFAVPATDLARLAEYRKRKYLTEIKSLDIEAMWRKMEEQETESLIKKVVAREEKRSLSEAVLPSKKPLVKRKRRKSSKRKRSSGATKQ
jgi:hypothetical protein